MALRRRRHRFELNADINVVSLIDVMLLLLVIFMITAPMMQGGVDLSLPTADAKPLESKEGLTVSVTQRGEVYIGEEKYTLSTFRVAFNALAKNRLRNGVYLRADKNVPYETVLKVITMMNASGVNDIGLVSQQEEAR
ncbi:MAG TPA: biopolymer transporter ExbD [Gemmatimonadaceae bacterium]|jgi:biopolymer transport protein ExbD/biopolymer transport protein TolR